MPTYEYVCRACGRHFEIIQSMTDSPLTICDECGGELRKVFAPPAIAFKGSGFYATDSRSKKRDSDSGDSGKPAEKKTEKPTERGAGKHTEREKPVEKATEKESKSTDRATTKRDGGS